MNLYFHFLIYAFICQNIIKTGRVRTYVKKLPKDGTVECAISEFIKEGILADFEAVYKTITSNEVYANITENEIRKYY